MSEQKTNSKIERRLAAILAADMVGYSRLMEADEGGTIARQKTYLSEIFDPGIARHNGRLVKTTGDGLLVEFASAVDGVECAVELQRALAEREAETPEDTRIQYRMGVNLGDIVIDGDDILGEGVNIAARLEGIAPAGGIYISGSVHEQVAGKLDHGFKDIGEQTVKNIAKPVHVYEVELGHRGEVAAATMQQDIRFCTSPDGVTLAYATVGNGPPLVKTANWLNHLEHDWQSPVWSHMLRALAEDHLLVRYDQRGNGLSDWKLDEISFAAYCRDLETVIDAAGIERFALFGVSQGCAVAIDYAVRNAERVTHLVLYGGYARGIGVNASKEVLAREAALTTLMRTGWAQDNPAFRQIFTTMFAPDATPEQVAAFDELQRITTSPENAARIREANLTVDVRDLLPKVTTPTLVLHCRDDAVASFESGRKMASKIPGARFVALEGKNHLILEDEPAWPRFIEEVRGFLGG